MNNKQLLIIFSLLLTGNYASFAQTQKAKDKEAKTTFQTAEPWKPETDVRADATMVYGTLDKKGVSLNSVFSRGETRGIRHNL
ncbi:hypothetical protein KUBF_08470 [Bacteroides finegoldii]|nr:hypothetical protein KUBF_08470 [Bacteroides finegoldii]